MQLNIYQLAPAGSENPVTDTVQLDHEQRQKGRLKVTSDGGAELRLFLERGRTLLPGDLLQTETGALIRVAAALEPVMTASCTDWSLFSRACYHLGNRHARIEVGERELKFVPDHVLASMLEQLGLAVNESVAPFVPESGAYDVSAGHASHDIGDGHDRHHSHGSAHDHAH